MPKADAEPDLYSEMLSEQTGTKAMCNVALLLPKLSESDRDAVTKAMADAGIYGSTICKVLKKRGFDISTESMRRHRRGACLCEGAK